MIKGVKISETMRREIGSFVEAMGVWEGSSGTIIIKRSQLKSIESYTGTLLHEIAHAKSGAVDITQQFEMELTHLLGVVSSKAI